MLLLISTNIKHFRSISLLFDQTWENMYRIHGHEDHFANYSIWFSVICSICSSVWFSVICSICSSVLSERYCQVHRIHIKQFFWQLNGICRSRQPNKSFALTSAKDIVGITRFTWRGKVCFLIVHLYMKYLNTIGHLCEMKCCSIAEVVSRHSLIRKGSPFVVDIRNFFGDDLGRNVRYICRDFAMHETRKRCFRESFSFSPFQH